MPLPYRFFGILHNPNSPRGAAWRRVMGSQCVPLRWPVAIRATIPEVGETMVYMLATERMTGEQIERLVAHLAAKFGYEREFVAHSIQDEGCPVLADDVIVSVVGLN